NTAPPTRCPKSNRASSLLFFHSCCRSREERRVARLSLRPLHSCGSSNSSLRAMKTMTPIIAAKNMAGKEAVDSNMLSECSLPAPIHNAIVCANRWFCWQRLLYCKATARGEAGAPRVGGVSKLYRRLGPALRDFPLGQGRPEALSGLFLQQVSLRIRI